MNFSLNSKEGLTAFLLMLLIFLVAIVILITLFSIYALLKRIENKKTGYVEESSPFENWWKGLTGAVPLEKEEAILLNHNYDGIRELDNHLPPWWKYLFYATIVFAVFYMLDYHIWNTSPLQEEEYTIAMNTAKKEVEEYQSKNASSIDEKTVKMLTDATTISKGKEIFTGQCVVCHGAEGQGGVGPNLTDVYWLHGGTISSIFKTIKYGVPEKGMIAWQASLKPNQIQDVSNYILTLKGTKPANPKAPQGVLEEDDAATDSTSLK
jgi:cytochrome c oxidase cbb3-type subunit III